MEVHTHTHSERKKWYHYFWEFFMLFLAVTLGFFVENQREHMVEHQRAKVFAANLFDELKKDTARLNNLINNNQLNSNKLDTFCIYNTEKNKLNITNGMLYYYASWVTHVNYFSPNSSTTIEQLKNSGNLRIMGAELAHKISEYDKINRALENEYSLSKSEFEKIEDLHFKIFDVYYMETLFSDDTKKASVRDSVFRITSAPIRNDVEMMKEYTGWVKFEAGIYKFQTTEYLNPIKQQAEELLIQLKKEYHLD